MSFDFSLTPAQQQLREGLENLGRYVIRPMSLEMDRTHAVPEAFLKQFVKLSASMRGAGTQTDYTDFEEAVKAPPSPDKPSQSNRTAMLLAEQMAWADASLLLCLPGPGLGAPPVRSTGTLEQKQRFFGIFRDMSETLRWGAYGLTEPGAGSDVSALRTTCRKDGGAWVIDGRKCYITNGARASWVVVFATVDASLGRAGQRAFVVEKGTPGFSVGKIEDKMGLCASETAELVFEECRVPAENLLGGEAAYGSKEGFVTAMKTFDSTRPLVAAMAIGIGRAAYEYARDFVKDNYVLGRPVPRYAAISERLARVLRGLEAARMLTWQACFLADTGRPNAKEASLSKAAAGRAAITACIEAIEICGAHGTLRAEHALLEKWFRDVKVYDIFEGTGQIQRVVVSKRIFPDLKSF